MNPIAITQFFRPQPNSRSTAAIAIPILAFFSIVLILPPFVWHYRNRNIPACSLIFWLCLITFFVFINALIWPKDNTRDWWNGDGLCDIEVKLDWAAVTACNASLCAIMRNLALVMDAESSNGIQTKAQRRRAIMIDILFCFGYPVCFIAVHYVIQPNRYNILTVSGCLSSYDLSWPTIVLAFIWPPIFCVWCAWYCVLVIIRLLKYRSQFSQIMTSCGPDLNKSRFMRLFWMAFLLLLLLLPVQFYLLYRNTAFPFGPYSWSAIHGPDWHAVHRIPTGGQVVFDRWLKCASGYFVFLFFGVGTDALNMYREWLLSLGLGRIFPRLKERHRPKLNNDDYDSSHSRSLKSYGSRARLFFSSKTRSRSSKNLSSVSNGSFQSPTASFSNHSALLFQTSALDNTEKKFQSTALTPIREPEETSLPQVTESVDEIRTSVPDAVDPQPWRRYSLTSTSQPQQRGQTETMGVVTNVWSGTGVGAGPRSADGASSHNSTARGEEEGVRVRTHVKQTTE